METNFDGKEASKRDAVAGKSSEKTAEKFASPGVEGGKMDQDKEHSTIVPTDASDSPKIGNASNVDETSKIFVTAKEVDEKSKLEEKPKIDDATKKPRMAGLRALLHYPKGVYFSLGNEFAERFSFYGMSAILTMYFTTIHRLSEENAKLIYHSFVFVAYFSPIFGSILADGFFGRYRVILSVSIIYCIGRVLLTFGAVPQLGKVASMVLDYTGLFVIALATGGIKPCVAAFAGDQFPADMEPERNQFFSFFYFMINLGALLATAFTPILRRQPCLGHETRFPLAFGVPAIFMFLATLLFLAGTHWYKKNAAIDNVIGRVFRCIYHALRQKRSSKEKKRHWLDHAAPKFDQTIISDVKALFDVLLLYSPVIMFWALFDQQGGARVIQANAMDGRVGRLTMLPDQMSVWNTLFIILLVPVVEGAVYPALNKLNVLPSLLKRITVGGFLAVVSFVVAGFVQLAVD